MPALAYISLTPANILGEVFTYAWVVNEDGNPTFSAGYSVGFPPVTLDYGVDAESLRIRIEESIITELSTHLVEYDTDQETVDSLEFIWY